LILDRKHKHSPITLSNKKIPALITNFCYNLTSRNEKQPGSVPLCSFCKKNRDDAGPAPGQSLYAKAPSRNSVMPCAREWTKKIIRTLLTINT
jgi:hypothetical protein